MDTTIIGRSWSPQWELTDTEVGLESWDSIGSWGTMIIERIQAAHNWVLSTLTKWVEGFRTWKSRGWGNTSVEQQTQIILKSPLRYFYYHGEDINLLESIANTCEDLLKYHKQVAEMEESRVLGYADKISSYVQKIVTNLGGDIVDTADPKKKFQQLSKQLMSLLKAWEPTQNQSGDVKHVNRLIVLLDRKRALLQGVDVLMSRVGVESPIVSDYSFLEVICLAIFYYIILISLGGIYGLITIFIFQNIYSDYKDAQRERGYGN